MPSSVLKGSVCEACAFEEDAASEARDGSMMKAAVLCEVAPQGHQEVAWLVCDWHVGVLRACGPECLCVQGFGVEFSRWVFAGCKVFATVCVGVERVSVCKAV